MLVLLFLTTLIGGLNARPAADNGGEAAKVANGNNVTVTCPVETGSTLPLFVPHPYDCTKYFVCINGVGVAMQCPDPLYYDPVYYICNWQWEVNCTAQSTTAPPLTTTVIEETTTDAGEETTTDAGVETTTDAGVETTTDAGVETTTDAGVETTTVGVETTTV